jgi:hypothetical protein
MSEIVSKYRGTYTVLFIHEVDIHVQPDIAQPHTQPHNILDRVGGRLCKIFVLRTWETEALAATLPAFITRGKYRYYTWKFIQLAWADKSLHDASRFPYNYDATLPQHRLNEGQVARPQQDDYPVWYFLVGPIEDDERLAALLEHDHETTTRSAQVKGLTTVSGAHCKGLVESYVGDDRDRTDTSFGRAYLVQDKVEEDRLRYFQTSLFKVVSRTSATAL